MDWGEGFAAIDEGVGGNQVGNGFGDELEDEVAQELNIPDPSPEKAAAILKETNEDTEEHDREGSSGDN